MELTEETLIEEGYSMPFEGEEHQATVVEIPFRQDVWRDRAAPAVQSYLSVILAIAAFEKVIVLLDQRAKKANEELLSPLFDTPGVQVLPLPYDDAWARDNTPVFVQNEEGEVAGVDFGFNAWGGSYNGLYSSWKDDDALGRKLLESLKIPSLSKKDFILEGGSIHTNGKGTLLTTEECLLSKGRNPSLSKAQIEEKLKKTLGQRKVIWLPKGVVADETDGHVDNMACFLDETHVLLASCDDPSDPMWGRYREDLSVLTKEATADGRLLEVIPIPIPGPLYQTKEEAGGVEHLPSAKDRKEGVRLAGSYVNFYMGKRFLILPFFDDPNDQKAYDILNSFYRGSKKIIPVPGREILLGGGNVHCVTKQIPLCGEGGRDS